MNGDKPLRGTQVLLQRIANRDRDLESLRARIAVLEARKKDERWEVHVDGFRWVKCTYATAQRIAKDLIDLGAAEYVRVVEDP